MTARALDQIIDARANDGLVYVCDVVNRNRAIIRVDAVIERRNLPAYELMRKNIQVEIKGKEGYFTIAYIGKDPRVVTTVTDKLASLFIEENLKLREQQAEGTSEFLSIELKSTKAKLEDPEKTITQFKRQFMGELPEQKEANLKVLEQLQLHYQRIGENIRAAHDRKLIIQKQLADTELLIASAKKEEPLTPLSSPGQPERVSRPAAKDPNEVQLEQMKTLLADLQSKYTERHPDILVVKKKIAELETVEHWLKAGGPARSSRRPSSPSSPPPA